MGKRKSPWRPMSTAPKDGEIILVCEWVGTDAPFVIPAAWVHHEGENSEAGWWGVAPAFRGGTETPHRWKEIAITPACWMHLPEPECGSTTRRRYGQLLRDPDHA